VGDEADEGVDAEVGDEGRGRRQRPDQLDPARGEGDLLLGLAQRRRRQVGVDLVLAAAGEGDLAGVAPQVLPPLGEDQPRLLGPAVEGEEDRRGGAPVGVYRRRLGRRQQPLREIQMITATVPPSTDQAAPDT
jgi:hypothetical protein